jgi:enoyl-CoA hydratase/carnithine racemase
MAGYESLSVAQTGGRATITFERPESYNAMNARLMKELIGVLESLTADRSVRSIVITGRGKAFMSGADIKEYAGFSEEEFNRFQQNGRRVYELIEAAPQPVIAAVNGYALGGGCEIALACDIIIAARDAKIGLPEINLGLVPGGGGVHRLVAKLGFSLASWMVLTGVMVDAQRLHDRGLIALVCDRESLDSEVQELCETLGASDAEALTKAKRLLRASAPRIDGHHYDLAADSLATLFRSEAGQARINEFLQKSEERASRKRR